MSDRETQPGSIIPGVDWESGVKRLMGNEQLYRKLLAKFAASYGDAAGRIRDALSAGDRQTAHNELHTLKGVTANLSLAPLADLVLAAEQAVTERLGDEGRILVRKSGTEPVLRVMAEAGTAEECEKGVDHIITAMEKSGHLIEVKK